MADEARGDGWMNLLTGLGMAKYDKKVSAGHVLTRIPEREELVSAYRTDGIAQKIVDRPVNDMLRQGFEIKGDQDQVVLKYLNSLQWKKHTGRALRWDRLFGGALVVLGVRDNQKLDQPLNKGAMLDIDFIRVVDAYNFEAREIEKNPESKRFGLPVRYAVHQGTPAEYLVHYSRCYRFEGVEVPPGARRDGSKHCGGDSVLVAAYEAVRALGVTYSHTESIMEDFVTTTLTIRGLQAMISTGREKEVLQRLHIMDMAKSILNTVLLDEEEKHDKSTSSVAGLTDVIDKAVERVSACCEIPVRILMGKQGGGLNNEGEGETRDWYDHISSEQEGVLSPFLQWLISTAMQCKQGPTRGKEIDGWAVVFNPLWQLSDKDIAGIHKTQADADSAYIDTGVLRPEEVAMSRFGQDEYSLSTELLAERVMPEDLGEGNAET